MDKPGALRLAELLEDRPHDALDFLPVKAAAELRRLHAENERLHQINQSHEMKLSVRGYEIQIADLEAQRNTLLEALKAAVADWDTEVSKGRWLDAARAAIARAEEQA